MTSFTAREYPNAEMSETAYLSTDAKLLPLRTGTFTTRVSRMEFSQLWLNGVQESGPRLKRLLTRPDRFRTCFLMRQNQALLINGEAVPENGLVRYIGDGGTFERSAGPMQWCTISMPAEAIASVGIALADRELSLPERSIIAPAPPQAMLWLRRISREAATLNERQSKLLEIPEVAHRLEQALIAALIKCLAHPDAAPVALGSQNATLVVDRFRRMIELHSDEALYIPEVCVAIRVPERTLRLSCQKILGMGPARYLLLRRLHLAHRALGRATPGQTSVTAVATRFGFWHFGRFAATYRSLFGELPSATLSRDSG